MRPMRMLIVASGILLFVGALRVLSQFSYTADEGAIKTLHYDSENFLESNDQNRPSRSAECNCDKDRVKPGRSTRAAAQDGEDFNSTAEYQVPNIVHYLWFNTKTKPLKFYHMLSVLSAHKFLNPDVIYFHTNKEPSGPYWDQVRSLPKVKVVHRDPPEELYGEEVKKPMFYTSHSNVDRVKVLMEFGGIYLDFDVIVTKPFDDLRKHTCTMGLERETQACGSVIVCNKNALFLKMFITAYLDDYRIEEWAYNTGKIPWKIWKRFPQLIHMEETKLNRPNFKELSLIWGPDTFKWRDNYAVHTWYRLWKDQSPYYHGVEPNEENIKTWNGTWGEMARTVLYGRADKMVNSNI